MSQDLRALLRDRKTKGRKLNVTHDFCLDPDLLDELEDLTAARESVAAPFNQRITKAKADARESMAGTVDTSGIEAERDEALAGVDGQIADLKKQIRESSIVLHFRALPGDRYEELSAEFNMGTQDRDERGFFRELIARSFVRATLDGGDETDLTWTDVLESAPNNGEIARICTKLVSANQVALDLPFSLKRSGKTP